jgi:hypothetical protein
LKEFAEPEEIKQGQNMLKLAYYSHSLFEAGLILVPYPSFDRITDYDHPYAFVKDLWPIMTELIFV